MEEIAKPDPLDMNQYRLEKLPKRHLSSIEVYMAKGGIPLAVFSFILFNNILTIGMLEPKAQSMLAIFISALILWITEAIPNYLTSLSLIAALIFTQVLPETKAYAVLGHKVIWLNVMSFILASMLTSTGLAKRIALIFITKFGKGPKSIFLSFIAINLILSAFISATAAKAAILLPILMVVAAVYGATMDGRNNFGRNLLLNNLLGINVGCNAYMTGSAANLVAMSMIVGTGAKLYYADWFFAGFPLALITLILGWLVGTRLIFKIPKEERLPKLKGGMERLSSELELLGKITIPEIKAMVIFVLVLFFWATDKYHGISATAVSLVGAIITLLPKTGVIDWNKVDIPWHLMLFSCGAYAIGAGLKETGLAGTLVESFFLSTGLDSSTSYFTLYIVLTGIFLYSHLVMQSKTMRTIVFLPIVIGIAQKMNIPVLSLALPVALCINVVMTLPFNAKPNAILYCTGQYSQTDAFKFGIIMTTLIWGLVIILGKTYFSWLGITL